MIPFFSLLYRKSLASKCSSERMQTLPKLNELMNKSMKQFACNTKGLDAATRVPSKELLKHF